MIADQPDHTCVIEKKDRSDTVEALFENQNLKAFSKLFKEEQEQWGEPKEFLRQTAEFLAFRSYEDYYGDIVPAENKGTRTHIICKIKPIKVIAR